MKRRQCWMQKYFLEHFKKLTPDHIHWDQAFMGTVCCAFGMEKQITIGWGLVATCLDLFRFCILNLCLIFLINKNYSLLGRWQSSFWSVEKKRVWGQQEKERTFTEFLLGGLCAILCFFILSNPAEIFILEHRKISWVWKWSFEVRNHRRNLSEKEIWSENWSFRKINGIITSYPWLVLPHLNSDSW